MNPIAFLREHLSALWLRALCLLLAGNLAIGQAGFGIFDAASQAGNRIGESLRGKPGHYTDRPGPVFYGENPGRDPVGRGGMWTPQLRADLRKAREKERREAPVAPADLMASVTPLIPALTGQGGGETSGGGGNPGEGGGPGGGSTGTTGGEGGSTGSNTGGSETGGTGGTTGLTGGEGGSSGGGGELNTNTGNRHAALPIVGWSARGQNGVSFVLHHNSKGAYSFDLGKGWSHSYDVKITHNSGTSAIIRYGDGLEVPYTEASGVFTAPAGYHDDLVLHGGGTWTLTTKHQWVYGFDVNGRLVTVTDRNGNVTTISRNGSGKPTSISDGTGRTLDFTYTGGGLIETITDPMDRVWELTYNGSNQMTDLIYPELDSTFYDRTYTYNANSDILTETDRRGKTWTYTYDGTENLLTITNPLSKTWTWSYTATAATLTDPYSETIVHNYSGGLIASAVDKASYSVGLVYDGDKNVTEVTDKRGKVWEYTYDSDGNVLTMTNPLNKVWTYTYDGDNNLLSAEDPLTNETEFTYDGNGNLLEIEDPLNRASVTNTYNGYGELIEAEDALGRVSELAYDSYGNVNATEDPSGVDSSATHNLLGRILTMTNGASSTYSIDYDEWMRPVEVTEPGSAVSSIDYDAEGNVTGATDALSRSGSRAYDDLGRLTSTTNANSETQSYAYDFVSRLTSITNGRSYARTYTYTDRGEVASLTLPDSSVEAWSYNGNGAVTAYTNPLSQVINYTYDHAGQNTGVDYPAGTDTSFTYDDAGRPTAMVDSTGTSSWTYNAASEVTQLSTPQGVIDYAYNLAGQRTSMDQGLANPTTYAYDAGGRIDTITDPFSDVVSYTYDAAGRVTRRDLGNGTYETFGYDSRSRVTSIDVKNSSNATLLGRSYVYDAASQITQVVEGAVTTDYDYDDIGQLVEEDKSTGYLASYTYDANGNRATRTINSVTETYTYDAADKLTAISGGSDARTFSYDAAGRTTAITRPASDVTTFAYDYESRVTSITRPGMTTNTFEYNGLDTRVEKVDSLGTATLLRDGVGVTARVLDDGSAVYTPGGEVRSSVETTFHAGIKNSDLQTNGSQASTASRLYDAFGNVLSSTGTWKSSFGNAGKFGYQEDADSGFKLLGHRYYDSSTGRFLTRDTIKDGRNWYVYCDAKPVSRVDPNGERWHDPVTVKVDKGFTGKVWVVGEPGPGKPQTMVQVMPGSESPAGFDVDILIVQQPTATKSTGDNDRYFTGGVWGAPSDYFVGAKGDVREGRPVWAIPPFISNVPLLTPVAPAKHFTASSTSGTTYPPAIYGGTGDWNKDIEVAKKH